MDFESSLFDETKTNYDILYKILKQIINGIENYVNIITGNMNLIDIYLYDHIQNNSNININQLLSLIDKLEFMRRIDMYKLPKYDPYIF
jgi:hypothetical protein